MNSEFPPEHREAGRFLETIKPFDSLSQKQLLFCVSNLLTTYHRAFIDEQQTAAVLDYKNPSLFVVRAGVFDIRTDNDELVERVSEGGFFGFISLLTGKNTKHKLHVVEDGLLYRLDKKAFKTIRNQSSEFDHFFNQAFAQRLRVGLRKRPENTALATVVQEVMAKGLIAVNPDTTIRESAQRMCDHNIASLAIIDDQRQLLGLFTDSDCRKRVVAESVDISQPIEQVMTSSPITVDQHAMVHEATLIMIRHKIKHLPVTNMGKPVGMLTLSDLIRLQASDPVLIINDIHRSKSIDELAKLFEKIPELLLQLIKQDVRADDLGRILTSVTGALTRHLIHLAQLKLGKEPCPFVWLAFGSQGRQDQSAKSDQDNGLLIANNHNSDNDGYFYELAQFVNRGLDACGYVYCPGDIMAKNPQWRISLDAWKGTFHKWISEPSEKALMHTSIFFDMRPIHTSQGAEDLFEDLQKHVLKLAKDNGIFLALLTNNALGLTPPLGFIKQLVVETSGEQENTFDIKKRGIMPITDIARIHALSAGMSTVNTRERIQALIERELISDVDGKNLLDAQEFISHQRLLHQGLQLSRSQSPDNHINPSSLSQLTARQLTDAFKVVRDLQRGLKLSFQRGLL